MTDIIKIRRVWVLGASDPEMQAIDAILRQCGEQVVYAQRDGHRVTPGEAYHMTPVSSDETPWGGHMYMVECGDSSVEHERLFAHECVTSIDPCDVTSDCYVTVHQLDHHRRGDRGFGATPDDFFTASSIGQVWSELCRLGILSSGPGDLSEIRLIAAADHCLAHAYAGHCPGISPDMLMKYRAKSRARYIGKTMQDILSDIDAAKVALDSAEWTTLGCVNSHGDCCGCGRHVYEPAGGSDYDYCECPSVADMRGIHVSELPEAGCRYGIPYIADGLPGQDGRVKVVCSGPADVIEAFLGVWAPANGLEDCYGDPARGFAGGYKIR